MNTRLLPAILLSISMGLCLPALAYGEIPNPGLDVTGGSIASWNLLGTASALEAPDGNGFAIFSEGGAGLARLTTTTQMNLSNVSRIAFRYRLVSNGGTRDTKLPPDAFIVRVYDGDGSTASQYVSSIPMSQPPMSFASAYYRDTDPDVGVVFDTGSGDWSRWGPDADGFYVVRIDLTGYDRSNATIEFDFAYTNNGEDTWVQLDGIFDACPAGDAYCCQSDLSEFTWIDDGECCAECREALAKVVVMLDVTGSINRDEMGEEVAAVQQMLSTFSAASVPPFLSVGMFSTNVSNNAEVTVPSGSPFFVDAYGSLPGVPIQPNPSLYDALADIDYFHSQQNGTGGTDVKAAINAARTRLLQDIPNVDDSTLRKFIVIVSDGRTTHPGGGNSDGTSGYCGGGDVAPPNLPSGMPENCGGCDGNCRVNGDCDACLSCVEYGIGGQAWCEAENETQAAELDGITIISIFFDAGDNACKAWCGEYFMKYVIATSENSYIDAVDSSVSLDCALSQAVEIISCPAGTECVNGNCQ